MAEYIDRVALLSQYTGNILTAKTDYTAGLRDAIQDIKDAPVADVTPVIHGEWEPIINADGELEGWMCKCCGTETKQKSNYCPSCGCRMDGEYRPSVLCEAKMDLEG